MGVLRGRAAGPGLQHAPALVVTNGTAWCTSLCKHITTHNRMLALAVTQATTNAPTSTNAPTDSSTEAPTHAPLGTAATYCISTCIHDCIAQRTVAHAWQMLYAAAIDHWTAWIDRDDASGDGDNEGIEGADGPCGGTKPIGAECERVSDGTPSAMTGEVFERPCSVTGLVCLNAQNSYGNCSNYRVRYQCSNCFFYSLVVLHQTIAND